MASTLRFGLPRAAFSFTTATRSAATTAANTLASAPITRSLLVASPTTPSLLREKHRLAYPRQGKPQDQCNAPIPKPYARNEHIPKYPYGPRLVYKQSNSGLYGQARIQFGNNVSEKHNVKTPRKWRPNVMRRRLFSLALNCWVQTRLTRRVLRTIDKVGGLDEYLLGEKAQRIKDLGPWGWKLRWRIMQSKVVRDRFQLEREAMGLVPAQESLEYLDEHFLDAMDGFELEGVQGASVTAQRELLLSQTDTMLQSGAEFDLAPTTPDDFAQRVILEAAEDCGPEEVIKEAAQVGKVAEKQGKNMRI